MKDRRKPATGLCPALAVAVLTPYLARIPGMFVRGPEWLFSYFPSLAGVAYFAGFAALPGLLLFALGKAFAHEQRGYWLGLGAMAAALFALHVSLDLASDSTAAIALVVFPFLAMVPTALAFGAGLFFSWLRRRR